MREKVYKYFLSVILMLSFFTVININNVEAAFSLKKGDILISNGTSSAGLTGHAGIAIDSNRVLHIAGPKKTTSIVTWQTWKNTYGKTKGNPKKWTKVYRHKNSTYANKAGSWAYNNYWNSKGAKSQNKKPKYSLGGGLVITNSTYCSKIVYQAYQFGNRNAKGAGFLMKSPFTGVVSPYKLPQLFKKDSPKLVGTF